MNGKRAGGVANALQHSLWEIHEMPFYRVDEIVRKFSGPGSDTRPTSVVGEFMKCGVVTKPDAEGPPLHEHPNEEQFTIILEGEMHWILGEEDKVVGPGTLIHIPRNTRHRSRPVNGPATYLTIKSPPGTGNMNQDYHKRDEADEVEALYPGSAR